MKLVERKREGENIFIPSGSSLRGTENYSEENPLKVFWDYDDFGDILDVSKGTLYRFNSFLKKKFEETQDRKFYIYYMVSKLRLCFLRIMLQSFVYCMQS